VKIVRFKAKGHQDPQYGIYGDDYVRAIIKDPFSGMVVGTSKMYPMDEVTLLAPCVPTKIVAVGLNYRDHAEELGMDIPEEPLIFLKPPSSILGPGGTILIPPQSNQVEHEAELAVIVGKRAKNVRPGEAKDHILGYTCLNDVTARDLQKRDIQFTRSKGFDTFCPIGPWIETEFVPEAQAIQCIVNGEVRQSYNLRGLIHNPYALLSFVSHVMTLEPGDVIATGTPKGVSPILPGDEVVVWIEGIGKLKNSVSKE